MIICQDICGQTQNVYIDLIVTAQPKSTIGGSFSNDNISKLEILDNAKIYNEKISLGGAGLNQTGHSS